MMGNGKNVAGENVEDSHRETLGEAADEEWVLDGEIASAANDTKTKPPFGYLEIGGEDETTENKTFDELRKNVQKKIDEKLMENEWANSKPIKIKLAELPVRGYLQKSLIPLMTQAFETLAKERPPEPIEFLATYLIKNKAQYQKY